jgi:steroid 5-alpha reductase family enzyme
MNFVVVSAASLAILVLVYGATFLIGRRIGRYNVVDVTWGASFVVVAAVAAVVGNGDLLRRLLLLVLVAVWGLRLAWHMVGKSAGKGEDPRYDKLLRGDFSAANVIRKIFLIQAAMAWFISLPLQLSASVGPTPVAVVPVLISCAGSRPTPSTRARSWTAACGRGHGIPTTSAIRRCGGGCG